ncbi:atp2, beta subunit of the F1 sector of mitochondrial F1F0 ATP synthase [Mucor velutinosus]|uniref:Atp2, beta subunit of the F1 sector of mitochondrial F1F0 ATP synthase n=1 Tax=Mucor velutinosus TaxID=708070 RepID=A0AAN7D3G6_9FUNG|nr:atp2, beta subunit of the F1 sector of mitochondrial F1F0 ATP synthase [Mucor velutinosus]
MRLMLKTSIVLIYCTLSVLAKGGGGGRGGGGGSSSGGSRGGSSGGSSGGSTGGRGTGSTGSTGGRGVAGTGSTPNSVSSKGGSGGFGGAPPSYYSSTRSSYTNYPPAYSGGYSPASRYGYTGFYNPALIYFAIMPPFLFYGYHSAYHRYNQNNGYYYAPQLTEQGSNTNNVIINGTANSGKDDNYHISFNISTNNQYPMVDHAFFASSDHNARNADFVYRLQFSQVIEFEDANQNGFYDANEQIYSVTSLQNLAWQPFQVTNLTVPNNATQSYLQTGTAATAAYNNTAGNTTGSPNFTVRITYRTSNLQLNNTAPIIMQPNSLQYDFSLEGFPTTVANAHPNARLGVAQLLSTHANEPVNFDVNMTTPLDVANQIKTNLTYGLSIGDYTEGRSEYQPTVNISDASGGVAVAWTNGIDANTVAAAPAYSTDDWIWGAESAPSTRVNKLLLITMPGYTASGNTTAVGSATMNTTFSGFGFLDTDVMNALASSGGSSSFGLMTTSKIMNILVVSTIATYFIVL